MRPILIQSLAISGTWQRLAAQHTVLTVAITASPTNTGPVSFRVNGGPAVPWPPGVSNTLVGVDLFTIEVSGGVDDSVLVTAGFAPRSGGPGGQATSTPGGGIG